MAIVVMTGAKGEVRWRIIRARESTDVGGWTGQTNTGSLPSGNEFVSCVKLKVNNDLLSLT